MRAVLLIALVAGCGSPASTGGADREPVARDSSTGEERPAEPSTRARIGIPSELRPDAPTDDAPPAPTPPAEAEPAPGPESPAEPVEIAGWAYLREARQHVAHTYRAEIQGCFDAALARGPRAGRLVIAMVPHADGRVASSRVVANETADAELGDCVVLAARRWQLPTPPHRTLEVQLRFTI